VRLIGFSWTRHWGIIRDQGEPGDGKKPERTSATDRVEGLNIRVDGAGVLIVALMKNLRREPGGLGVRVIGAEVAKIGS